MTQGHPERSRRVKSQKLKVKKAFSAAGVVYREEPEGILWLVIKAKSDGKWRLPKGGIERNETSFEAAQREIEEEGGVEGRAVRKNRPREIFFCQRRPKDF